MGLRQEKMGMWIMSDFDDFLNETGHAKSKDLDIGGPLSIISQLNKAFDDDYMDGDVMTAADVILKIEFLENWKTIIEDELKDIVSEINRLKEEKIDLLEKELKND